MPETLPEGVDVGWWRVDLTTGQTLGMADNGRGASFSEYLINNVFLGAYWGGLCLTTSIAASLTFGQSNPLTVGFCASIFVGYLLLPIFPAAAKWITAGSTGSASAIAETGAFFVNLIVRPLVAIILFLIGLVVNSVVY